MKKTLIFVMSEILILIASSGIGFLINGVMTGKHLSELTRIFTFFDDLKLYEGMKFLILIIFVFLSILNMFIFFGQKKTNIGMQKITPDIEIPISAGKTLDSAKFLEKNKFVKSFTVCDLKKTKIKADLINSGKETFELINNLTMNELVKNIEGMM